MNNHQIAILHYREKQAEAMRQQNKVAEPEKVESEKPVVAIAEPEEVEPINSQRTKNFFKQKFERVKQLVIKHLKKKR
jgi:alpha/beta superfamily hydrolase